MPASLYALASSGSGRTDPSRTSTPVPGSSGANALFTPLNRLPEMFDRWPRYRSHGPAGEMWSVVHLPAAFIEHAQAHVVAAVPRGERLEQLEALAPGLHDHLDGRAVGGRRHEPRLAGVEARVGELVGRRGDETKVGAVGPGDRVVHEVDVEAARQRHRGDGLG